MAVLSALVVGACGSASAVPTRIPGTPTARGAPHLAQSSLRNAGAPPARYGAALGYDPVSKDLILFGGATVANQAHPPVSSLLDDTWAWNGQTWQQLHPGTSPPALYGAEPVVDPTRGQLLLLGGSGQTDSSGLLLLQQGAWTWDGQTWAHAGDNPLQMPFPAVGADPVSRQVLLGGNDSGYQLNCGGRVACPVLAQINKPGAFVWNGRSWTNPGGSAPQWSGAGTAFDPITGQLLSAGGSVTTGLQSTYSWDGKRWTLIGQSEGTNGVADPNYPSGPCAAATDADAGNVVMVCTFSTNGSATGATWTFDGTTWNRATQATTALVAIPQLSIADDPAAGAVIMVYPPAGGTEQMRLWNGSDWVSVP